MTSQPPRPRDGLGDRARSHTVCGRVGARTGRGRAGAVAVGGRAAVGARHRGAIGAAGAPAVAGGARLLHRCGRHRHSRRCSQRLPASRCCALAISGSSAGPTRTWPRPVGCGAGADSVGPSRQRAPQGSVSLPLLQLLPAALPAVVLTQPRTVQLRPPAVARRGGPPAVPRSAGKRCPPRRCRRCVLRAVARVLRSCLVSAPPGQVPGQALALSSPPGGPCGASRSAACPCGALCRPVRCTLRGPPL